MRSFEFGPAKIWLKYINVFLFYYIYKWLLSSFFFGGSSVKSIDEIWKCIDEIWVD